MVGWDGVGWGCACGWSLVVHYEEGEWNVERLAGPPSSMFQPTGPHPITQRAQHMPPMGGIKQPAWHSRRSSLTNVIGAAHAAHERGELHILDLRAAGSHSWGRLRRSAL